MLKESSANANLSMRRFGVDLVGEIPWGTHLCQFYESKQDLIDILVPYFAEGLRSNEFCMWVTSPPLEVKAAQEALAKSVPHLEKYLKSEQIEIISYKDWYLVGGKFDSNRVLQGWVEKETASLKHGFEGLRLTGNTFWIERDLWNSFVDYEEAVNSVIDQHKMLALCTYCLTNCTGTDVLDVVRNHVGTLVKQSGRWYLVEDAARRKVANGTLMLSEARYSALFGNLQDGFAYHKLIVDENGRPIDYVFLEVNPAFERMTGLKRADLIGKRVTEAIPGIEKDPADWIGIYGKVALKGEAARFENYAEPLKKWYNVSAYSPEKGYFCVTFEDVTQRKEAEGVLNLTLQKLHLAQETAKSGTWEWNLQTGENIWSDETWRLYGLEPGCAKASYGLWQETIHPDDRKCAAEAVNQAAQNKTELNVEYRISDALGKNRWLMSRGQPVKNAQGTIEHYTGIVIDITERKKAEQALKEYTEKLEHTQKRLKEKAIAVEEYATQMEELVEERTNRVKRQASLIDLSPDAIIVRKIDDTISFWSAGAEKLYGWTAKEAIGKISQDLLKTIFPVSLLEINAQIKKEGSWTGELSHKTKDGRKVVVDSRWLAENDKAGRIIDILESNVDITARKKAEARAEEGARKLKDAERLAAIGATAGMVGHDIRNPLQAIINDAYFAKSELDATVDSEQKKWRLKVWKK